MRFYLHREGVQFTSRGNFNGIGMRKTVYNGTVFSYPGLRFAAVYRQSVYTRVWRS